MTAVMVTEREWVWKPLRPGNFTYWLRNSHRGARFTYHIGNLMVDRVELQKGYLVPREPLHSVASEAQAAAERGEVILVQKRLGENLFLYEARRIGRTFKREEW